MSTPRVVKVGGRELVPGPELDRLVGLVGPWVRRGGEVVLVHGGGDEITARADALGLPTIRRSGQRVTDAAMLEVVVEVLGGRINVRLVQALTAAGLPAVGLSGASAGLLRVRPGGRPPGSLGYVGEPERVRPRLLERLLADGLTPVVAPLGTDGEGGTWNVNADLAAAAIAAALGAELLLVTDVAAVRGRAGEDLPLLRPAEARALIAQGVARDGMIPKLEAALAALDGGAVSVWIGPLDVLGPDGPRPSSGTWVRGAPARARPALLPAPPIGGTEP